MRVLRVAEHIGNSFNSLKNWTFYFQSNLFLFQMKQKTEKWKKISEQKKGAAAHLGQPGANSQGQPS
jgi:hypothetical protein